MWKQFERGMEKWGHYFLALLCAGVILLSAAWTRELGKKEQPGQLAASDQSERMEDKTAQQGTLFLSRPVSGAVVQGFSEAPVYFPDTHLWSAHLAMDYAANPGDKVCAMLAGRVISCEDNCVHLAHENGMESVYRGLQQIFVSPGQPVVSGGALGLAGSRIPFEGEGRVCVAFFKQGKPVPFEAE